MKVVLAGLLLALVAGCGRTTGEPTASPAPSPTPTSAGQPAGDWFVDRAEAAGLRFTHFNGGSGEFYYPEVLPPGVALFDYDNDGDLDVFAVQGQMLGGKP